MKRRIFSEGSSDGRQATFLKDTGADINVLIEEERKRLDLPMSG